jgi:hypothetical protein
LFDLKVENLSSDCEYPGATMPPKRKSICDCRVSERASKEPGHSIQWDERLHEYHIVYGNGGRMMLYYGSFCGGSVPKSRRDSLFAHVSQAEQVRIYHLLDKIRNVADVLARFGPPDERVASCALRPRGQHTLA